MDICGYIHTHAHTHTLESALRSVRTCAMATRTSSVAPRNAEKKRGEVMGASPQKKSKTKSKLHFTSSVALRNTEEKCCDVMDAVPKKNQNQDCSSHLQSRGSKIKKCIPH